MEHLNITCSFGSFGLTVLVNAHHHRVVVNDMTVFLVQGIALRLRQSQEGGGYSIVFQLRLLTDSACQCDVT